MPDKLPQGWVKTTLAEVNVPSRARALPSEVPDLPYVGMEHVEAQTMKLLGQGHASGLRSSSVRFSKGDVLYGKMRPYLNKVWLAEFDGLCSAEFLVFPKFEGLNSQLFAYRLNSQDFVTFANHQVSGDRPRVDFGKLAKFPYLLPPSREQERIVAKLNALLSRVAAGEAAARRALDRLQRYRAAVLHAAVTGELTREWRKTHNPGGTGAQLLKRLHKVRRSRWELHWFTGKLDLFITDLKKGKFPRSRVLVLEHFLRQLCSFRDKVQPLSSWDGDWDEQWNEFKSIENLFDTTTKQHPSVRDGATRFRRGFGYLQSGRWKSEFYSDPQPPRPNTLPVVPRGWASASIDQLGWASGYGTSVKCTYDAKGPAVLRIPNIRNREFDFTDLKYATKPKEISDDGFVAPGDFLLIRTNGSIGLIGRAGIAKSALGTKCSFASYLIRFRLVGEKTLWSWISLAWDSHTIRSAIQSRAATTAGQYNVSLSGLADLALPLPPLTEQLEIVREVERCLAAADRLAVTLSRQLDRAQVTRQSLLREAFAGRLARQDSKDEPAAILLKRICADREAEAKKPKPKRMPKPKLKSVETLEQLEGLVQDLGKGATPERLLLAARLGDNVEKFFDLLRAGRDNGSLVVPVGKSTAIRRVQHAN